MEGQPYRITLNAKIRIRQGIPKKWENHVWSYTFLKVTFSYENQLTLAKFTILDFAVENKPVEYYMTLGNKGEIKKWRKHCVFTLWIISNTYRGSDLGSLTGNSQNRST